MRLIEVLCFSIVLAIFSSIDKSLYFQLVKLEKQTEEIEKKTEALKFISESFYNTCCGKGFMTFDEWEQTCEALWSLESIQWKICITEEGQLYCGEWKGPYGEGTVFYKK